MSPGKRRSSFEDSDTSRAARQDLTRAIDDALSILAAAEDAGFAHGAVAALLEAAKEIGAGLLYADWEEGQTADREGRDFDPQRAQALREAFLKGWTVREFQKPSRPPQSTETVVAVSLPRCRIALVDLPFSDGMVPAVLVGPLERPGPSTDGADA
jgi:hypothetical protein